MVQRIFENYLKLLLAFSSVLTGSLGAIYGQNTTGQPNVLFIAVDDLNDWIGTLGGHPQTLTPNFDRLANQGVLFENAFCAAPACNPSRVAVMTGKQPINTGVYKNEDPFRNSPVLENFQTLPHYFKQNGYTTLGSGKMFHGIYLDPDGWDTYYPSKDDQRPGDYNPVDLRPLNGIPNTQNFDWGPIPVGDDRMSDWKVADWVIDQLDSTYDKPFFLACGIYRPHLPFFVPEEYFEDFPLEDIILPPVLQNDLDDIPSLGLSFADPEEHATVNQYGQWDNAVQAYLASIHFADKMVGLVLDALEASPYADNTLVVLWSDHGWSLGEKESWRKFTLWEEAGRVPVMFSGPGIQQGGRSKRPINLVDLYPTLVDLCGLPYQEGLDGQSLKPLLENPSADWPHYSLTSHTWGDKAIRSEKWRYIRYANGEEELYDHDNDPNEWYNLAGDSNYDAVKVELGRHIPLYEYPSVQDNPSQLPPFSKFTVNNFKGTAPLTVNFDASLSLHQNGNIASYSWDFGDGSDGTGTTTAHTYTSEGTFVPILSVTDNNGNKSSYAMNIYVEGTNGNTVPTVDFSFSPNTGVAPVEITFTSNASDSDGTIQSYAWEFGDGETSTDQNPVHEYGIGGSFNVRLTVVDDQGARSARTKTLVIQSPAANIDPVAAFSMDPNTGEAPLEVNFDASSSSDSDGTIEAYLWDFGDGTEGSSVRTSHTFTEPGTYMVSLRIFDNNGAEGSISKQITVIDPDLGGGQEIILQAVEDAYVKLAQSASNYGEREELRLKNNGNYSQESYVKFTATQAFAVNSAMLRLFPNGGTKNIIVEVFGATSTWSEGNLTAGNAPGASTGAIGSFSMQNGNDPVEIDVSSFVVGQLAPGESISFLVRSANPNKDLGSFFTKEGGFPAELLINAGEGPIEEENQEPVARITASPQSGTTPLSVAFSATGSNDPDGSIVSYTWDFGDGNTASGVTTNHVYGSSGTFTVTLTITDDEEASSTANVDISVTEPQSNIPPEAIISADPLSGFAPLTVSFDASASSDVDGTITYLEWNLGDGNNSIEESFTHTYDTPGTYKVLLSVLDNSGVEGVDNVQIIVEEENSSGGEEVVLQAVEDAYVKLAQSGSNFGGREELRLKNNGNYSQESYIKFTSGENLSINSAILRLFPVGGTKNIIVEVFGSVSTWSEESLTAGNAPGASTGTIGSFIMQNGVDPVEIDVSSFVTGQLAVGESISFLVRSANPNKDLGSFFTREGGFPAELLINLGQGPVEEENQDPLPQITATPQSGTAPLSVAFSATGSSDPDGSITSYTWDFGDGNTASGESSTHLYTEGGTFTAVLSVTDNEGATGTENIEIVVSEPVSNIPPTAVINADPTSGTAPLAVSFDGSNSSDVDGSVASYSWEFGDGNTDSGSEIAYSFNAPGNYTVTLTVLDNEGAEGSSSVQINVSDPNSQEEEVVLTAIEDSYIKLAQTSSNFGTQNKLQLKNNGSYSQTTYLKFDLAETFAVNDAFLRLFPLSGSANMIIEVFGTSSEWTETGLLPPNAPSPSTASLGTYVMTNDSNPVEVDVSSFVVSALGGDGNISFLLKAANTNKDLGLFYSKEGGLPAELVINANQSSSLRKAHVPFLVPVIQGLKIYPNPFSSELSISLEKKTSSLASVTLLGLNGKVFGKWSMKGMEQILKLDQLSKLSSGFYILVVEFEGEKQRMKLFKQ